MIGSLCLSQARSDSRIFSCDLRNLRENRPCPGGGFTLEEMLGWRELCSPSWVTADTSLCVCAHRGVWSLVKERWALPSRSGCTGPRGREWLAAEWHRPVRIFRILGIKWPGTTWSPVGTSVWDAGKPASGQCWGPTPGKLSGV